MAAADAEKDGPLTPEVVVLTEVVAAQTATLWDPHMSQDWDQEKPTEQCILRIKRYRCGILRLYKWFLPETLSLMSNNHLNVSNLFLARCTGPRDMDGAQQTGIQQ